MLKQVVPEATVQAARRKAEAFIAEDVARRKRASEVWAFGNLPEGQRTNWADCREPELRVRLLHHICPKQSTAKQQRKEYEKHLFSA